MPIISKLFDKRLLTQLKPAAHVKNVIPLHQLRFLSKFRNKPILLCSFPLRFASLAKSGKGLLCKAKGIPSSEPVKRLKVVFHFYVKVQDKKTNMFTKKAGVPHGSELWYKTSLLQTTINENNMLMRRHRNSILASNNLQNHLNQVQLHIYILTCIRTRVEEVHKIPRNTPPQTDDLDETYFLKTRKCIGYCEESQS